MTEPVTPEECPDPSVHGNPFRYCPNCTWTEIDDVPESPTEPEGKVDDSIEAQIRAAETAQQASVCVRPDDVGEDERAECAAALAEALDLRVEVNLAQYDDGDVRRVGSTDPRVRELEAPWTRKARRAAGSTR